MDRPWLMVSARFLVAVRGVPPVLSVTVMLAVVAPVAPGVPLINPPVVKVSPEGRPVTLQIFVPAAV